MTLSQILCYVYKHVYLTIVLYYKIKITPKIYGLNNLNTFINFIHTIKFIRNICAHAGVLYDLNFPQGIYKIPRAKFNDNNNQSLDAGIKTISFILKNISEERHNDMNIEINKLFKEYENNETIKLIITDKIGYKM